MSGKRKTVQLLAVFVLALSAGAGAAQHPAVQAAPAEIETAQAQQRPPTCCRVCRTGKACGDSCIARDRTCRAGAGCACNADGSPPGRLAPLGLAAPERPHTPIADPRGLT